MRSIASMAGTVTAVGGATCDSEGLPRGVVQSGGPGGGQRHGGSKTEIPRVEPSMG